MASKIRINTGTLGSDADSVDGYISKMEQALTNLTDAKQKLDTMWDGPASNAFNKAFDDDIYALRVFIGNLKKVNQFERTAKTKYEKCETQVNGLIAGINV